MRQLANKNLKTAIINTFKGKYEHNENRDEKYIKEPSGLSRIKNVIQSMENSLNGLNGRLGNAQGKIVNQKTQQQELLKLKKWKKNKRASVSCGKILGSIKHIWLKVQRRRREIFEKAMKNFFNLIKTISPQIQAQ